MLLENKIHKKFKYLGESKFLLYFGNESHNFTALDTFAEILNVRNYSGLWEAKHLECYSKCYSLDLPQWLGAQPQNPWF